MQKKSQICIAAKQALIFLIIVTISLSYTSCASKKSKKITSSKKKTSAKPTVQIEFAVAESQTIVNDKVAQSKVAEIENMKEEESKKISQIIQDYYEVAFLNPELWENGKFSKLDSFFASEIKNRVRTEDFNSLCLADASKHIDFLKTLDAKIPDLWLNIDENLKPKLAIANSDVKATFIQKDGKTAYFESSAIFFLESTQENEWQIFDYNVKYELKSGGK